MRCKWCNTKNALCVDYHDNEWCVPKHDDRLLFELLILEGFQAGLSWECILNKRENFKSAFDNFDVAVVADYREDKINSLLSNSKIVRNRRKIEAAIVNARAFMAIQKEFGSFDRYIWGFTNGTTVYEVGQASSSLSDRISSNLKEREMRFVGTTIIYSYLQSIGVVYSHEEICFLHK